MTSAEEKGNKKKIIRTSKVIVNEIATVIKEKYRLIEISYGSLKKYN